MTDFIKDLCERLSRGTEIDAHLLARRLGRVAAADSGSSIKVAPFDASLASAEVTASADSGVTSMITLVPARRLLLTDLETSLGPFRESPRLHPFDLRKFVFSPADETTSAYEVRVVAYVSAPGRELAEQAPIEKLLIFCSPSTEASSPEEPTSEPRPVWQRLLGEPARFRVRSLRDASLDEVQAELEEALGVRFFPLHDRTHEGPPALTCVTQACDLGLSVSPSQHPDMQMFDLVGVPAPSEADTISDELVQHLRSADCDWYVPHEVELLEEAGELGHRLLDRTELVSILAPQWLGWFTDEKRDAGRKLLESIVDMWLTAARRTADPIADVKRRRVAFQGWLLHVPPSSRLRLLASYAIQEQLTIIEDELLPLKAMTPAELGALRGTSKRLAEWRDVVVALAEPANATGVTSIQSLQQEVLASIDELARRT